MLVTHDFTIRAYCRVDRCGDHRMRLEKRNWSSLNRAHSIQAVMATDRRDWSEDPTDAWLWAIVNGWPMEALKLVAEQHGWTPGMVQRLCRLRLQFTRLGRGDE